MMRKFKLIKEYPGSPKLGYETKFNDNAEDWNTPNMLLVMDCKNYPEFWEEIKDPIFVTDDEVEVFEGDEFWFVDKFYQIGKGKCSVNHSKIVASKDFSTKESAEKYIEQNKPIFSVKDIEEALKYAECSYNQSIQTLFKQKLGI